MKKKRTFSATKRRHFLACVLALLTSVVIIPGMTTYLPFAMSEQILMPIMLFPLIWTALFMYAYMAEKAWHPLAVMVLLIVIHGVLSFIALTGATG